MVDCALCRIACGDQPAEVVYADDRVMAVMDIAATAAGQTLVMTREHYPAWSEMPEDVHGHLLLIACKVGAAAMRVALANGYNIIAANGTSAGQLCRHPYLVVVPRSPTDGLVVLVDGRPGASYEEQIALAEDIRERVGWQHE